MSMKRTKTVALLLIVCFIFTLPQVVFAATKYRFEEESWKLHNLGLFAGASVDRFNPDLGAVLNRQVGVTLLLNFFGKRVEVEALSDYEINQILSPFIDQSGVLPWARPYMAYAVKTGMVLGTSSTTPTLGHSNPLDGVSYAAMILRHLGYSVNRQDFINSLNRLDEKSGLSVLDVDNFNKAQLIKDDAVGMVYYTLFATCSDGISLIEKLINTGIISMEKATALNLTYGFSVRTNSRPVKYNEAYFQILDALKKMTSSIWLVQNEFTDTFQEIKELVDICVRENPEILYYGGISYSTDGRLFFKYRKDAETNKRHLIQLEKKVEDIINTLIKPGMTDYQKELAIHDYLVQNCQYDIEGFERNQIRDESFNAYGALCLGVAVCEGYAEAAAMLLNRTGVDTIIVTGQSRGYGHAWNMVKIDGDYYHLDVTWDDPITTSSDDKIYYEYFNITDNDISMDHQWTRTNYPSCTESKYQYFAYNNLVVKDQNEFISRVIEEVQRGNKEVALQVRNEYTVDFNIESAVNAIVNRLYLGCSYSYNKNQRIAYLFFK